MKKTNKYSYILYVMSYVLYLISYAAIENSYGEGKEISIKLLLPTTAFMFYGIFCFQHNLRIDFGSGGFSPNNKFFYTAIFFLYVSYLVILPARHFL